MQAVEALDNLLVPDNAAQAHDKVMQVLTDIGYTCTREYFVPDRGDGRRGRIDVIAVRGDERYAIEIDNRTARKKSIYKLAHLPNHIRLVALRNPSIDKKHTKIPKGIDDIICMRIAPRQPLSPNDDCRTHSVDQTSNYTADTDIITYLGKMVAAKDARLTRKLVANMLERLGCKCWTDYKLRHTDGVHAGYVDIIALRNGKRYAIEIDKNVAHKRAITNLYAAKDSIRIILLRSHRKGTDIVVPKGIDYVIALPKALKALPI